MSLSLLSVSTSVTADNSLSAVISDISITYRPASNFGQTGPDLETLNYCVTWTTTDEAMAFQYEITDALGQRPPYGNAYQGGNTWPAGQTNKWCADTTLEFGKTYTIRVNGTSGPRGSYGTWAGSGPGALLTSYSYSTGASPVTTTVPAATTTVAPASTTIPKSTKTTIPSSSGEKSGLTPRTSIAPVEDDGLDDEDYADIGVSNKGGKFDLRISSTFPDADMTLRATKRGSKSISWNVTTNSDGNYRIITTRSLKGFTLTLWIDGDKWDSLLIR